MPRKLPLALAAVLSLTITADAAGAGYATRTLQVGSSGSDVRLLQRYLDKAGYDTAADGAFGPMTRRSVMRFERAEERRVNGRASRAEQGIVRARASAAAPDVPEAPAAPTEKGYLTSSRVAVAPASAPDDVKAIIDAGNVIAKKPYKYGGGHGDWNDSGYDCSGSVSYALHGAGLLNRPKDSGELMSWRFSGRGEWITVYANSGHVYMKVAGLRFDTSGLDADGTRWHDTRASREGYAVRHPRGL
jgi:peptidoglycan hydrolase-like protein with peptidoglycan-binding domain